MRPGILLVAFSPLALLVTVPAAADSPGSPPKSRVVQRVMGGEIDWGSQAFYASGEAPMPGKDEEPNRSKAYLKARGSARTKAVANLLLAIDSAAVDCAVSARQLLESDDTLGQTVEAAARGAGIASDRRREEAGETVVEATLRLPMYGPDGPGEAILRSLAQQERSGQFPVRIKVEIAKAAAKAEGSTNQRGPFSSLIVDARGLRIQKAMNPRIRRPDGSEVWGGIKDDVRLPDEPGPVSYASSTEAARRGPRAGKKPLIVRAVGRAGAAFLCDPVVTTAEADRVLLEDKAAHFLRDFRVILVVDPLPS